MSKLRHAAIITDGNGRWATRRGLPRTAGHTKGRDNFQRICDWCLELGIPYLSFYTLSLDNLKRDKAELDHINALAHELCSEDGIRRMREKGIRVLLCGRRDLVAESDLAAYEQAERETADCSKRTVMLQGYYGGRDEIVRAARQCVADGAEISEEAISARLYAAAVDAPDPDLILRTGGCRGICRGRASTRNCTSRRHSSPTSRARSSRGRAGGLRASSAPTAATAR